MPSDYQKICDENIRRRGEEFDDIGRLISQQLYSDRSHFVYELLQNAEDALARRFRLNPNDNAPRKVQFRLYDDRLEFRHFGLPFDYEDVKGISDVLKGTKKEDYVQIGKFGIGFKSVYAFTASPEIHSGEEHFIIKRYIRPETKNLSFPIAESETVFNFPFDHKELRPDDAFNLILAKLRGLGPRVLLFLRWIDEIEWHVEADGEKGQYLKETIEVKNIKNARRIKVNGRRNGKNEDEKWLIFERFIKIPDSREYDPRTIPVEIGFCLRNIEKDQREEVASIKDSSLVVYFPTEKETRLGFLIQGAYNPTPGRDNILNDNWNKTLIKETADLLADMLPHLKNLDLITISLLEALPIRTNDFPPGSMFYPIFAAVCNAFKTADLLPADDGTFVSARYSKLARGADLRKLLNHDRLTLLFQKEEKIKWLTGGITQNHTPDLRLYLMTHLEVEEVRPDKFIELLSEKYFESQDDKWMIDFYAFLKDQTEFWKKQNAPLRNKKFIRLENDSHVIPFKTDGTPNAYLPASTKTNFPTVKKDIAQEEIAREFLIQLGLFEPDLFAEVIEFILPKYTEKSIRLDDEDHIDDLKKIKKLFDERNKSGKSDDLAKMKTLLRRLNLEKNADSLSSKAPEIVIPFLFKLVLPSVPFLKASDSQQTRYKSPKEIYINNSELLCYFQGNNNIWFLVNDYPDELLSLFRVLDINDHPKVKKRSSDNTGYVIITDYHGWHARGLNGFDPDIEVDGLDHALASPSAQKSKYIWNEIVIPHADCIRGIIEKSSKKNYQDSKKVNHISHFGHTLMKSHWLPGNDGEYHRPSDLRIDDLPEQFERNNKLADLLGMKKDVDAKLAEEVGISVNDINLIRNNPEEFSQWKAQMAERVKKSEFPERPVINQERREEKVTGQINNADEKRYEERGRSVRTSKSSIDPSQYLRSNYTNAAGQMICQICEEEMPFKKRDGNYYFEAVEIISRDHLPKEYEAQYLALCPLCSAKYKEFIKTDENAMTNLRKAILSTDQPEVPLSLGEDDTMIRFVAKHYFDIKTILKEQG